MEKASSTVVRKSGIDLLRILAILMICMFHARKTFFEALFDLGIDFQLTSFSRVTWYVTQIIRPFGSVGNILFMICSAYFLVDNPRARGEKAVHILSDNWLISVLILVVYLICGVSLSSETILNQIFPTTYKTNWFVSAYVIFYLLAPIVIVGLKNLSKRAHFGLCIASVIFYGFFSLYDPILPYYSLVLPFFYILNLVAFIKWYIPPKSKRWNFMLFFFGSILFLGLFFGCKWLRRLSTFFDEIEFASLYSPFLVFPLIGLFNLFRDMKFSNRAISYLSTCSLFVYVIHENELFRSITREQYYIYMIERFGINYALAFILLCGIGMFLGGFVLAVIYNETFHRLTKKISATIWKGITFLTDQIYNRFFHSNNQES